MKEQKNIIILVVEDLVIMRRLIKNTLNGMGFYSVIEAEDGQQALQKLEKVRVDLIITDWLMNNVDGIELTRKVREMEHVKDVPILMVTALSDEKDVRTALKNGVNDYVVKPFTTLTLKKKICKLLNIEL